MDNILKVLLSVLGVAGLLAMFTPTGVAVAPVEPVPIAVPMPVNQVNPVDQVSFDEPLPDETEEEIVKFGEPMIDGNPVSDEDRPQQPNPDNPGEPAAQNGSEIIDYQQILDRAAQGSYGVQPYKPITAASINVEMPDIEN